MIDLYTGTPGTGKSLDVARLIKKKLKKNVDVIANFEINEDAISYRKNKPHGKFIQVNNYVTPVWLYQYSKNTLEGHLTNDGHVKEGSILLILDECQLMFNSRDWQKPDRTEWLTFFAQHRKYGFDIVLVTQMERAIDRQIRGQVVREFNHRKLSNFKWFGRFLSLLAGGPVIVTVVYYKQGCKNIKDRAYTFIGNQSDYDLYDSYKIF